MKNAQRAPSRLRWLSVCITILYSSQTAAVTLGDAPLYSAISVPGNLALALSVEWPTATTPAYPSSVAYSSNTAFLGYFDPNKCYRYIYNSSTPKDSYFTPNNITATRTCISTAATPLWSGNYLNWASMQTLDTFRWVLTGGYRSTDTTSTSILTKTYASFDSGVMPDKSANTGITTATPLNWGTINSRLRATRTEMYITSSGNLYSSTVYDYTGENNFVISTDPKWANSSRVYRLYINVKVCDASVGLEENCVAYGSNYKPEGLLQKYAQKLRYAAFGYYNDSSGSPQRDGGVMRAKMKYIGPTQPTPGGSPTTNSNAEWNGTTGVMVNNPDSTDATTTNTFAGLPAGTISNSGVMNYLNKFGNSGSTYKSYDPVGELYYAVTRYFRNKGNVPQYSDLGTASNATKIAWLDGFPVITTWNDPIQYYCQKNFILGIGDVNAHRDANLPGTSLTSGSEPAVPSAVSSDVATPLVTNSVGVNVTTSTNMVGQLEGITSLGTQWMSSGRGNTYYMAGLAYDAHVRDIRPDLPGNQNINTYWMDVYESGYTSKNQYWLATKYGGFTIPSGFNPYATSNGTTTIPLASWSSDATTLGSTTDRRPDNYFPSDSPDKMKAGLEAAFSKIVAEADGVTSTGFAAADPVQASSGNANYTVSYQPGDWFSLLKGQLITYDSSGTPTFTDEWDATALLNARTSTNRQIVTCCTSAGAGLPFTYSSLSGSSLSSRTYVSSFSNITGVSSGTQSTQNFIAYLRGDRTREVKNGGAYRDRKHLLGDVVNAKLVTVGPPSADYFDSYNPGYSDFAAAYGGRPTIVFAGANDGMLHAFDGTVPSTAGGTCTSSLTTPSTACGKEVFAYIPSFVYGDSSSAADSGLAALGKPTGFSHRYYVNSTPSVADVDFYKTPSPSASTNDWRTILVGGLGKGGKGYYALDITNPSSWTSEAAVAGKVLWEFTDSRMGYSYGEPLIVKTAEYGWTVIVSSGYNNSDGVGYLFMLNPRTGALLRTLATPEGSTGAPINLAYIQAHIPSRTSYVADAVYGGDLQGNVWRFSLAPTTSTTVVGQNTTITSSYAYSVSKIARLTDGSGAVQPVTTRPAISIDQATGKRFIAIGTGHLLADEDVGSQQTQSFYVIADGQRTFGQFYSTATSTVAGSTTTTPPGSAYPSGITPPTGRGQMIANTNLLTGISSTTARPMGWYFDLGASSSGNTEQVNISPVASNGVISFAANLPNGDVCNPAGSSRLFAVGGSNGISAMYNTSGATIQWTTSTSAVTGIMSITSPSGTKTTNFSTADGTNTPTGTKTQPVLKRMNWREIPSAD